MATTSRPPTARPADAADVLALADEHGVRFVRLWFTDVLGTLKSFAIGRELLADALAGGLPFDGSAITGFNPVEEADMVALPDPATFAVLPWRPAEHGVARLVCDVRTPAGAPYEGDPRHVLRRALERMHALGFDELRVAVEPEYFLFRDPSAPEPLDRGGYLELTALDAGSDVRRQTILALERLGIAVSSSHHEGGPSQHEVALAPADALKMADDVVSYRMAVKEVAMQAGWHATFMPKPLQDANGSGMHTHLSLLRDGRDALGDPDDRLGLSETGRRFIAGQLRHARELSSLFAQWANSYKRLVPGFEAPVHIAWSRRNRSALVRVAPAADGQAVRAELRAPDPACNPYLVFAVLLQAGLDGIECGYQLPEPMEQNLYSLAPDERRRLGIEQLPATLGEAIEVTAGSELVLRTLGEHIFDRFLEVKRREWDDYRVQVTPWELERYLPVL